MNLPENAPIERIFNVIWVYALQERARAIRLMPTEKGTKIFYQIGDEWRQQMKIPQYVHAPLLRCIDSMREAQGIELRLRDQNFNLGINWRLRVEKAATPWGESVDLVFEAPQIPPTQSGDDEMLLF